MLYLRTFGGCQLERDGARLDELGAQRKALAFLALLACAGTRGVARDTAAALLWPESDDERARSSLKQLVHALRTRVGAPEIVLTNGDLRLNPERASSDVAEFREAVRSGERSTAARLYNGPFLDGFYLRGSAGFEEWSSEQRAALAREHADVVRQLAQTAERDGDRRAAVDWWRRLVDADRFSAAATVGFMRALDAAGERAAALRQAGVFQRLVREELECDPDPAVIDFAEQLRRAPAAIATAPASTPDNAPRVAAEAARGGEGAVRPTLLVLPFENTSGEPQDEPFTDGLTDELIGTIGKLRGIAVVGRTTAFAFKGARLDAGAIAARLNAASMEPGRRMAPGQRMELSSILEGSVRRIGDRIRVGVQLVRAPDGVVLWSEIFDREARDLFALQGEIARAVSLALRVQLDPAPDGARPSGSGTLDAAAQELYLRGRFFLNRVSGVDLRQSVACFERAVERDPAYARAWAGIADARLLLAILGHSPAAPEVARVHAAVARALALDGGLAEAHTSLACVLFAFDWEWAAAEREFEAAIRLDPGYGLAHQRYGLFLMYQTRFDEARQVLESARSSDPLAPSVNMNLGRLHLNAGRPGQAVPHLETALELSPQLALAREQLGFAHLQLGDRAAAVEEFRRVAELSGPRGATRLAYALAATGDRGAARQIVREVAARSDAAAHAFGLALACTGLDDRDGAFAWLDRAYEERDPFLHTVKAMPAFAPLHGDGRWGQLLDRIRLS